MIMVPILLLNMLIAMMGNTYAQVIQQSEKEFVKQVSKVAYGCNFQKRPVIFLCYMRTIIDIIASFYYASGHGASFAWCQWSVHRHGNDHGCGFERCEGHMRILNIMSVNYLVVVVGGM